LDDGMPTLPAQGSLHDSTGATHHTMGARTPARSLADVQKCNVDVRFRCRTGHPLIEGCTSDQRPGYIAASNRSQCLRTESQGNKTWISKNRDQRLARQTCRMPTEFQKIPPQRLCSVPLARGNVAVIFVCRTCPRETGLDRWDGRIRTWKCRDTALSCRDISLDFTRKGSTGRGILRDGLTSVPAARARVRSGLVVVQAPACGAHPEVIT